MKFSKLNDAICLWRERLKFVKQETQKNNKNLDLLRNNIYPVFGS